MSSRWGGGSRSWPSAACSLVLAVAVVIANPVKGFAQLNGQNIKGDAGLKSGSQAPPGTYIAVPLYFYTADQIKDHEGKELRTGSLDAAVYGPALSVVTTKKIAGGNYGFLIALPWANNRVQGANDFDSNPGAGLTDMFIQPINLGWHQPRADATVAYDLYIPTGRYEDGADNNTGLGMWAHELLVGTTVYLNDKKSVHAATTAAFDFQSEKKDSTTKVGNILNLERGAGADFLGGGLTAGLAYYGTFKLTNDRFDSRALNLLIQGKNQVWGLGPEFTLAERGAGESVRVRDRALPMGTGRKNYHRRCRLEPVVRVPTKTGPHPVARYLEFTEREKPWTSTRRTSSIFRPLWRSCAF